MSFLSGECLCGEVPCPNWEWHDPRRGKPYTEAEAEWLRSNMVAMGEKVATHLDKVFLDAIQGGP